MTSLITKIKYGGRAVAVATHPTDGQTAFVVSESGGIFRTTNGGSSWLHVSGKGTFWFSDVLVYPPDPNIVIATAYRDLKKPDGGGIWRSTSGGGAWSRVAVSIPPPFPRLEAYSIAVEPGSNRIWVGTSVGLAYSDDRGATWSFLPPTPNFNRMAARVVIAPKAGHLRVLTAAGFRASNDGGATWVQPNPGMLQLPTIAPDTTTHNQLAASPANDAVLYWSGRVGNHETGYSIVLLRSKDGGLTWGPLRSDRLNNRPSFVRVTSRVLSGADKYQVYYGNGHVFTRRFSVDKATEAVSGWQTLTTEHPDSQDIAFKSDGFSPWLLVGDGGIQTTKDQGATWKLTAGAGAGYNALQISDAVGQKHAADQESDLYFGTQDNKFWASHDNGRTWNHTTPVEGYHLNIGEEAAPGDHSRITYVDLYTDMIAGPLFSNPQPMNVPGGTGIGVRRLGDGTYMKAVQPDVVDYPNVVWVSRNSGGFWFARCNVPTVLQRDRKKTVGEQNQLQVFFALSGQSSPGTTEIMRATGLLDVWGTAVLSTVTGFGELGLSYAYAPSSSNPLVYEVPYAVDPFDPDHIIAVDASVGTIKVTRDGGATWTVDTNLVARITDNGRFLFRFNEQALSPTQVIVIAFDRRTRGRILVGTVQAGVIFSCDHGQTWRRLEDSEHVPNISSFHFTPQGWILASSYGRGLWRLRVECPPPSPPPSVLARTSGGPFLYAGRARIALSSIEPDAKLSFIVTRGGDITGYRSREKPVDSIEVTSGNVEGLSMSGEAIPVEIPIVPSTGEPPIEADAKLAELLDGGLRIKGMVLEEQRFKGFVLADREVAAKDLPKPRVARPALLVRLSGDESRRVATVQGAAFEPLKGLEVRLDDETMALTLPAVADRDGKFQFDVAVPPWPGHYVLIVRQPDATGTPTAAASYDIPSFEGSALSTEDDAAVSDAASR